MNTTRVAPTARTPPVPRSRVRLGFGVALGIVALVTGGFGLAVTYGVAAEYGGGSFADIAAFVVGLPTLFAALAVFVLATVSARVRWAVVVGTAVVTIAGGLLADTLGDHAKEDRLVENSRDFTCNGPNAEVPIPAYVDRTWDVLPRRAPIYGSIEGTPTSCTAAVQGDGAQTYAEYTAAFRDLDGWQVRTDQADRFVMTRNGVAVTVRLTGAPDRLTTIEVAANG